MRRDELLQIMSFADAVRDPFGTVCGRDDAAGWRIVSALVEAELRARALTVSALVIASRLSHGSAIRRINAMIEEGLILRRPANAEATRFTLHPSAVLMDRVERYAVRTKRYIAGALGARAAGEAETDYYFSAAPGAALTASGALRERLSQAPPLTFLLNDDNYFAAMRNMWADLRANLGRASDFVLLDQAELYREGLRNGALTRSVYDLIAVDMPWLGEFATRGLILSISSGIRSAGINPLDFSPSVWATTTWAGETMGLPIYCTIEVLACRSDLFAEAGINPPRTFDEVIAAGRHFHQPRNGRYGIGWNAKRGMPIASSFMFFLGSCDATVLPVRRSGPEAWAAHADPASFAPLADTDAALEALDYMHRLLEITNPAATRMDWNATCDEFMRGDSAMCYVWTMRAMQFETDLRSTVAGRVAYLPQPSRSGARNHSPVGGFLLCIPANIDPARQDLAMEALAWMASREAMRAHLQEGFPVAPRFSIGTEAESRRHPKLVNVVRNLANRNLLATWQRPPVPGYARMEAILGEEIHDAMLGVKSDRQALDDARRRLEAAFGVG